MTLILPHSLFNYLTSLLMGWLQNILFAITSCGESNWHIIFCYLDNFLLLVILINYFMVCVISFILMLLFFHITVSLVVTEVFMKFLNNHDHFVLGFCSVSSVEMGVCDWFKRISGKKRKKKNTPVNLEVVILRIKTLIFTIT